MLIRPPLQTELFPFTAWEQAVFVVLLIALVGLMLAWMSRETKAAREFQRTEAIRRDLATAARDEQWRQFLKDQTLSDNEQRNTIRLTVTALAEAVTTMAKEVNKLREDFEVHDEKEWARLDYIQDQVSRQRMAQREINRESSETISQKPSQDST